MKTGWRTWLGFPLLVACVLGAPPDRARAQDLPSGPLTLAGGRIIVGADVSVSASTQNDESAWFNYTDYEHNTMRMTRIGLTTRIRLFDQVSVLGEVRSENGNAIRPYALYLRVRPWRDRDVDIQAGRIPPVFGAFSRRAYAAGNPLIGYPLAYQYLTSLRPDAMPATADDLLRMRARGWRPSYPIGSTAVTTGMPLITAFRWDTGVEARVGSERLTVSAAVTAGTLSDPHTRDNNRGKQLSGRLQWNPAIGLVLGGSAARGPYLADAVLASASVSASAPPADQRTLGFDAEYSRNHWLVRSEGVWSRWDVPTLLVPLDARGIFVEGTYKIRPGLFAAARVDHLSFSRLAGSTRTLTWDAPVTRVEAGAGLYVRRNLLGKATYQHDARDGGQVRRRHQLSMQFQFWL